MFLIKDFSLAWQWFSVRKAFCNYPFSDSEPNVNIMSEYFNALDYELSTSVALAIAKRGARVRIQEWLRETKYTQLEIKYFIPQEYYLHFPTFW
jgi:hypothetical protein